LKTELKDSNGCGFLSKRFRLSAYFVLFNFFSLQTFSQITEVGTKKNSFETVREMLI